jgi:HAD superfamily hydrolase (TIGR01509 family)
MQQRKGIIFDFNGTLFWDSEYQETSWDTFLIEKGIELTSEEKRLHIHGRNGRDSFEYIFQRSFSDAEILALVEEKEVLYRGACLRGGMQLAPGAIALLDRLQKDGIPVAIATASGKTNVDFFIEAFDLLKYFSVEKIIYNDGKIRGKPHPDLFLQAMKTLSISGREAIVFEDSDAGIIAAERAGAGHIIIVNSTGRSYERYSHRVITHFEQYMVGEF